jgi:transposase
MLYLESAPVQPYLQGMPRLRVQLLPDESRRKISVFLDELSPKRLFNADKTYNLLRKIIGVSAEQFIAWIYQLRDERPDAFEKIADLLVLGIEINSVFQKPANSTVAPNL